MFVSTFLFIFTTMRRSKVSAEEILKAEKAKDDRQRSRKNGYSMMSQRDAGWSRLRDYNGGRSVVMQWHTDRELEPGEIRANIPDGKFTLLVNGELVAFDAEEFRRSLRWV